MRKLVAIIFMIIIASNTYFGMYNEKGEKVTDIKEVLESIAIPMQKSGEWVLKGENVGLFSLDDLL